MRRLIRIAKCASICSSISYICSAYYGAYPGRYYEGGVSSVYLWDLDDGGFAGVVLLKKSRFHFPL
jgi:hypothetical protein